MHYTICCIIVVILTLCWDEQTLLTLDVIVNFTVQIEFLSKRKPVFYMTVNNSVNNVCVNKPANPDYSMIQYTAYADISLSDFMQ